MFEDLPESVHLSRYAHSHVTFFQMATWNASTIQAHICYALVRGSVKTYTHSDIEKDHFVIPKFGTPDGADYVHGLRARHL